MSAELDLECYDLKWRSSDGTAYLEALVPDGDGGAELLAMPSPYGAYCYVEKSSFSLDPVRATGCRIGSGAPDGYMRVEADHPAAIRDFDDRFPFTTYEADVHFNKRAAINGDVTFLRPGDSILYFDIEVDDRGSFAEPDEAGDRVLAIAAEGADGREFYFDDDDEGALIDGFVEAAGDYAVLAGWNSIAYDYPYLANRAAKLGMEVDWHRWVRHDAMPLYDMLAKPTETLSTKLDDTGEREFGAGKTGVTPGGGELYELWEDDPERLREYNERDVEIVRLVDEKYDLLELLHVICDICGYPPGDSCYLTKYDQVRFAIGQVVDAKVLSIAHERRLPQPNTKSLDKPDDFPGAYVLDPEPGMYDDVVVPDYSSMYPNVIRAWNFGLETFVPEDEILEAGDGWIAVENEWEGYRVIKGETGGFLHPDEGPRSVLADAADDLIDMREDAAEIVDKGIKAVNNTVFGIVSSDYHRYFGPHSENITLIGQELTRVVERIADSGHEYIDKVVGGDTDSIMISVNVTGDRDAVAERIVDDIETGMREWARSRGALAEYLSLDVDYIFDRFYIGDKKKRYFGRTADGDFKVRGFEVRQNSWPEPAREFQRELMEIKIDDGKYRPTIRGARRALFRGLYDHDLAMRTTMNKPVSEYSTPQPHVRAAEGIREKYGYGAVSVGDKVGYIKYGRDREDSTWVYDGEIGVDFREAEGYCAECDEVVNRRDHEHDDVADHPHFRDRHYSYIWDKRFDAVMNSIDVEEFEQKRVSEF